jgi:hypothetical protein
MPTEVQYTVTVVTVTDVDNSEMLETESVVQSEPDGRSPPLSTYSGSTNRLGLGGSNFSSFGGSSGRHCLASALDNVNQQPRATFDVLDWGWSADATIIEPDFRPTPRQRTVSLRTVQLGLDRVSSQLRPIPLTVPESLPSLYAPSTQGYEDDDDEQTEADSIWFCNEDQDIRVATTAPLPTFPDLAVAAETLATPPEGFEDFPDLEVIIAALQEHAEDVDVEAGELGFIPV